MTPDREIVAALAELGLVWDDLIVYAIVFRDLLVRECAEFIDSFDPERTP